MHLLQSGIESSGGEVSPNITAAFSYAHNWPLLADTYLSRSVFVDDIAAMKTFVFAPGL